MAWTTQNYHNFYVASISELPEGGRRGESGRKILGWELSTNLKRESASYRVFRKNVFFQRFFQIYLPLPCQHWAAAGCTENNQPIEVSFHSWEDDWLFFMQRIGWSELKKCSWTPCNCWYEVFMNSIRTMSNSKVIFLIDQRFFKLTEKYFIQLIAVYIFDILNLGLHFSWIKIFNLVKLWTYVHILG